LVFLKILAPSTRAKNKGLVLPSEKCSNCSKTSKEIERKWRELGW